MLVYNGKDHFSAVVRCATGEHASDFDDEMEADGSDIHSASSTPRSLTPVAEEMDTDEEEPDEEPTVEPPPPLELTSPKIIDALDDPDNAVYYGELAEMYRQYAEECVDKMLKDIAFNALDEKQKILQRSKLPAKLPVWHRDAPTERQGPGRPRKHPNPPEKAAPLSGAGNDAAAQKPKASRRFHDEWKEDLPWAFENASGKLCCSLCLEKGAKNSFTRGSETMTRQNVQEHARRHHYKELPGLGVTAGQSAVVGGFEKQLADQKQQVCLEELRAPCFVSTCPSKLRSWDGDAGRTRGTRYVGGFLSCVPHSGSRFRCRPPPPFPSTFKWLISSPPKTLSFFDLGRVQTSCSWA